ncbi:OmpA family protein [Sulfuricurvum sp.]|uniref:OmpA family protein n=1 Tax=Sulfuricurvum sp. TaxID=2025608 RepID=UPI00261E3D80|nr:OmpA family protein [Sulfuricurvum sp.]MDD4884515.1 OmpA family protein [Sulfuricurvum sp.]
MIPLLVWTTIVVALPYVCSQSQTTVVLLDNNTTHNAIAVATREGNVTVDKPYFYTVLEANDQKPSEVKQGDPDTIRRKYADVLSALPIKSESILFYFEPGTAEITSESKNQIDELMTLIGAHEPAAVDIIGHTDRVGDADKNYALALERARAVEAFLTSRNVKVKYTTVTSYGENDPLIKTEDGISEPKNRRVEVIIR